MSKCFKAPEYRVGSNVCTNNSLFTDAYSRSQRKEKLNARKFGPFAVKKLTGKNAIWLDLSEHIKIHQIVHVIHNTFFHEQPVHIALSILRKPNPVPALESEEYEVEAVLEHGKREKGYQFLTLIKGFS